MINFFMNSSDSNTLGIPIGFSSLAAIPIGFVIGFAAMGLYTRIVYRITNSYLDALGEGNTKKIRLKFFEMGVQFSLYDKARKEAYEKAVKLAALESVESSRIYLSLAISHIDYATLSQAQLYLQKCETCRPSIFTRFSMFQCGQDIDYLLGDRKSISRMIDMGMKMRDETQKYIMMFYRNLVSEKLDYSILNKFAHLAYEAEYECDRIFRGLIDRYPKNANVMRVYAQYLEELKFDREEAAMRYADADAQEQVDQERSRQKRRAFADEPSTPEEPGSPYKLDHYRSESALHYAKKRPNSVHPQGDDENVSQKSFMLRQSSKMLDKMDMENISQSSQMMSETERKQVTHMREISNKQNQWPLRIAIYFVVVVLGIFGIIAYSVIETQIQYVNPSVLTQACNMKNGAYEVVNDWRYFQRNQPDYNGTKEVSLRANFQALVKDTQTFRDNLAVSRIQAGARFNALYITPQSLRIPTLDSTLYKTTNSSGLDLVLTYQSVAAQALTTSNLVASTSSYPFMFFYYNRRNINTFFGTVIIIFFLILNF
jgi:hypothetical protein